MEIIAVKDKIFTIIHDKSHECIEIMVSNYLNNFLIYDLHTQPHTLSLSAENMIHKKKVMTAA